ncbi:hypothetical protein EBB07_33550 [Paenibacillaceae bacterium]|nr:hypothetical protein EBB07_33550 [Paenibacillaceae bacterium]
MLPVPINPTFSILGFPPCSMRCCLLLLPYAGRHGRYVTRLRNIAAFFEKIQVETSGVMRMHEPLKMKQRMHAAILVGVGAVLAAIALLMPARGEPEGWLPVNARLEAAIAEVLPVPQSGASTAEQQAALNEGRDGQENVQSSVQAQEQKQPEGEPPQQDGNSEREPADTGRQESQDQGESSAKGGQPEGSEAEPTKDEQMQGVHDSGKIDLNHATAAQLETIPGIGPAKAMAIIEDRRTRGLFQSIEEVTRVKGIGAKMFEKMKDSIVVNP